MTRHEYFKRRLKEMGLYDKNSDYGGLIGKWVEELSQTVSRQGHSGESAKITTMVFFELMDKWMVGDLGDLQ